MKPTRYKPLLALLASSLILPAPVFAAPQSAAVKASTLVTLNFVNADIEAVARAIGVMMNRQFIISPNVKGSITVYSEQPVTTQQAYLTFLASLRSLGFAVVDSGGLYKVVPEAEAKLQTSAVAVDGKPLPNGDQVLTQIFTLQHENANNVLPALRALMTPNSTINANPGNNSLVITDYAENLRRLGQVIAALDVPSTTDIEVVTLKHAVASDLAPLVQKLGDSAPAAAQGVPTSASTLSVLADPRTNSLILRAPSAARLMALRAMVEKLDQPSDTTASGNIHVVYLKNADAVKLAVVLRSSFAGINNGGSGSGGAGGSSGGAASGGVSGVSGQSNGSIGGTGTSSLGGSSSGSSTSSGGNSAAATAPVGASPQPSTGGFVQADPSTNSLIITAPEPMYKQVRAIIDQLDQRRAQIYVESMIVKIDATKAAAFGVQWQNLFGNIKSTSIAAGTNFGTGNANIINLTGATATGTTGVTTALAAGGIATGLNVGVLQHVGNFLTLGALANFMQTQTGANVLSTPNLVALDNEEAKIVVGQNVPFVTGTYTTATTTGVSNPFQTVDRQDVGLTLRIRSQVGEGNTVRMQIYEENSSVVASTASSTNGPTTDKSAVETTVSVDNGSILVLGGLMQDEYSDEDDSVPGLSSIPLLGNLFKNQTRTRTKTDLMVFLRPVVIRDQTDADQLTMDRYDIIRASQQSTVPQPGSHPMLSDTGTPLIPAAPKGLPPASTAASAPPAAEAPVPAPAPAVSTPIKQ